MLNPLDFAIENPEGSKKPYSFSLQKLEQKFIEEANKINQYPYNFEDMTKLYLLRRLLQYNNLILWVYYESVRFIWENPNTNEVKEMCLNWIDFEKFVIENCPIIKNE